MCVQIFPLVRPLMLTRYPRSPPLSDHISSNLASVSFWSSSSYPTEVAPQTHPPSCSSHGSSATETKSRKSELQTNSSDHHQSEVFPLPYHRPLAFLVLLLLLLLLEASHKPPPPPPPPHVQVISRRSLGGKSSGLSFQQQQAVGTRHRVCLVVISTIRVIVKIPNLLLPLSSSFALYRVPKFPSHKILLNDSR